MGLARQKPLINSQGFGSLYMQKARGLLNLNYDSFRVIILLVHRWDIEGSSVNVALCGLLGASGIE